MVPRTSLEEKKHFIQSRFQLRLIKITIITKNKSKKKQHVLYLTQKCIKTHLQNFHATATATTKITNRGKPKESPKMSPNLFPPFGVLGGE